MEIINKIFRKKRTSKSYRFTEKVLKNKIQKLEATGDITGTF
jgi:hypothetical protein